MNRDWRERVYNGLCEYFLAEGYEVLRNCADLYTLQVTLPAKEVERLLTLRHAESVWIEKIAGVRRRKADTTEKSYFAVRAIFAIQIEGQTTGLQTYEDRILLVKAADDKHAIRLAKREFRRYESTYLSSAGTFCRWRFEKIIDVCKTWESSIDPNGTEVYSELRDRRMKPEYEWHPGKTMKTSRRPRKGAAP
jgi:hypothetical protein